MRRIVHIGLGNFHRAHQVWWTGAVAGTGEAWEICSYTGRRPDLATTLPAQGGRYTLICRGPDGDAYELITALTEAVDGRDVEHFARRLADPATAIVTLTVTEPGYHLRPGGTLDLDSTPIRADREAVASGGTAVTPPGRLLLGLMARQRADAGPLAVVPCDNLPANGAWLRAALLDLAGGGPLADWIADNVSFVDTSVDRITPRATADDIAAVAVATGFADQAPVVAEPYRDWVLAGEFPGGRPAWERAGARFVTDIGPWATRKLYLLNGAHSLLAYEGQLRGHTTIAEAFGDPDCAAQVERWWAEVTPLVGLPGLDAYHAELRRRFANPAIAHRLTQVAQDAVAKLQVRVAEPALRMPARGGAARILAAWLKQSGRHSVQAGLAELDPALAEDRDFIAHVHSELRELP